MTRKRQDKPWTEMTAAELAEQTAEFDQEFLADTFRPLTAADRRRWERVRQKGQAPDHKPADSLISVRVKVEHQLLQRGDALARRLGLTRDGLIAYGLKAVLAAAGETECE